jgi:hypothetical protein
VFPVCQCFGRPSRPPQAVFFFFIKRSSGYWFPLLKALTRDVTHKCTYLLAQMPRRASRGSPSAGLLASLRESKIQTLTRDGSETHYKAVLQIQRALRYGGTICPPVIFGEECDRRNHQRGRVPCRDYGARVGDPTQIMPKEWVVADLALAVGLT